MELTGAASSSLAAVLSGPARTVTVTASLSQALYVTTADRDTPALCLATADAVRVPCAIVLAPGVDVPSAATGTPAVVGAGRVAIGDTTVVVTRWWRPARAPVSLPSIDATRRTAQAYAGVEPPPEPITTASTALAAALAETAQAGAAAQAGAVAGAVRALLGRGDGLTPLGDDVLAGALVTLAGHPAGSGLRAAVLAELASRPEATTPVSAALLVHAARGECIPEVAAVLTAPLDRLEPAVRALLNVGHSSGGGLLHGTVLGWEVLRERLAA